MKNKKNLDKKKSVKKPLSKNPTDPTVLAKDVMESFLGEPLTQKTKKKTERTLGVIRKKKR